jgi:ribonuclease HI
MLPKINQFTKKIDINLFHKKVYPEYEYVMNFDGCSKGNPGLAGCGAVIYHFGKEIWSNSFFVGENATNNQAEYAGLILGFEHAKELEKCFENIEYQHIYRNENKRADELSNIPIKNYLETKAL